ncbi:hypothetical protein HID58_079911 [Brassica napus]|uniref:Uncharacterized protein n=1 Tax=Brassica napus TaxID=3708 RepID=A0ABQ7Y3E9_BRANA|nr:hypothetical protein HID58_079911 [Brassica napus]
MDCLSPPASTSSEKERHFVTPVSACFNIVSGAIGYRWFKRRALERFRPIQRAHNNLERRPWLRQEYPTPQPCTAMAPNKEPWGKAAQATRHHIRVGKRAAGIHQAEFLPGQDQCPILYENWRLLTRTLLQIPLSTKSSIAKGSYFQPYWTHTSSWHSAMQKEVLNMGFASLC